MVVDTLENLEKYASLNHHIPGIPAFAECYHLYE